MNLKSSLIELEWRIRNKLTFSLPVLKHTSDFSFVTSLPPDSTMRFNSLSENYGISRWTSVCNHHELVENLYILDLCDRYIGDFTKGNGLDIGCKNWCYLPALTSFTGTPWQGVELDAYRRYWNMSTRKSCAKHMMQICPDCHFYADSLLNISGQYSLITWFLPFVKITPLRYWGLPNRFFEPEKLLQHAWHLLSPSGKMFVVNQGEDEADIQKRLFEEKHIPAQFLGELTSPFNLFKQPRFGWLVTKPA